MEEEELDSYVVVRGAKKEWDEVVLIVVVITSNQCLINKLVQNGDTFGVRSLNLRVLYWWCF